MKPEQQKYSLSLLLIIILGFAVYGNSLNGEFILDDHSLIVDNVYIRSWVNSAKIFSEDVGSGGGKKYNFYRPIQIFTYLLDHSLWRLNARGYHLTNILLHILVALAIYWLINLLYDDKLLSLLTSILFVVHPIHTEAVSYISGRADPLATLFMILSFISYVRCLRSEDTRLYILMLASYALAVLSRESSLIFPALLLVYHYAFKERIKIKQFLPILTMALFYILLRFTALRSLLPHPGYPTTILQRAPGFLVAITDYLRLLFVPFNLHMEYGKNLFQFNDPKAIFGALILFSLLTYAVIERKRNRFIFLCIIWFFVALFPSSNLYPMNAYMAEHWLYLPSLGFFLLAARALSYPYGFKNLRIFAVILTAFLLTFYGGLTIRQNNYWKEPITFYERTLEYAPDSTMVYNNLGDIYTRIGRKEEGMEFFKKAIQIEPNYAPAYNNLGNMYSSLGKREEAIAWYKKAIQINPNLAGAHYNLGRTYDYIGRKEEAMPLYRKAIQINPNYVKARYNLGLIYYEMGKTEEAITQFEKATEADPNYAEAYNNLGTIYNNIGMKKEAIAALKKAIVLNPYYAKPHYNLGLVYYDMGMPEEAIDLYKKTIEIDPDFAGAYNNLGLVYYDLGRTEEAISLYKRALELNPNYVNAYNNLGLAYYDIGKTEEAIAFYKEAIKADPNFALAYNNLGFIYYNIDKKKKAVTLYKKALKLKPNYAKAHSNLGNVYYDIGRVKEAIALHKRAIQINPNLAVTYNDLAAIYFREKQYQLAIEYCDEAIELGYKVHLEFLELLRPHR